MITIDILNSKKTKKINIEDLDIATFERKVNKRHLNEIKQAIINGDLHDNIITVLDKHGEYEIIDGQHRALGVRELQAENPSFSYKLTLRVLENDALNAYFNINKGKALSANDYTKAIDDGFDNRLDFFRYLKDFCSHYGSTKKLKYSTVLSCINYARSDSFARSTNKKRFADIITDIKKHELIKVTDFLNTCFHVFGDDTRQWVYKKAIIANLLRLFFKRFNDITNLSKMLKKISKDTWLKLNSKLYNTEAFIETYNYIERVHLK